MTRGNLIEKLTDQKGEMDPLQQKVWKSERQMKRQIAKECVCFKTYHNLEMKGLMCNCQSLKGFWKELSKRNKQTKNFLGTTESDGFDSRGMRWHPIVIKWCLLIRQKSSQAYDVLRDSGFINLPSPRTLFDYSHYLKSSLGLNKDVIECARQEAEQYWLYSEEWRK